MEICKQQNEIKISHLPAVDRFKGCGRRVGMANFFLGQAIGIDEIHQSIGIDETNTVNR